MAITWPTDEYFRRLRFGPGKVYALSAASSNISSALSANCLYAIVASGPWHFIQGPFTSGTVSQATASTTDFRLPGDYVKYVWCAEVEDGAHRDDAIAGKAAATGGATFFYVAKVL